VVLELEAEEGMGGLPVWGPGAHQGLAPFREKGPSPPVPHVAARAGLVDEAGPEPVLPHEDPLEGLVAEAEGLQGLLGEAGQGVPEGAGGGVLHQVPGGKPGEEKGEKPEKKAAHTHRLRGRSARGLKAPGAG